MRKGDRHMRKKSAEQVTAPELAARKGKQPICCVTAYDYPMAQIADSVGIDLILVGDSLGNVVMGHTTTIPVTLDDMVRHTAMVSRAVKRALVVADLPFLTYQISSEQAMASCGRLIQEGGAQAVKMEGGVTIRDTIARVVQTGIPVLGHVGMTPQSVNAFGGHRLQGRGSGAQQVLADAVAVQEAGAFAVVLELIPAPLAAEITRTLSIPTIGIGAGPHCDGQVQVLHDLLGLTEGAPFRHVKRYAELRAAAAAALNAYRQDVADRNFPTMENAFE